MRMVALSWLLIACGGTVAPQPEPEPDSRPTYDGSLIALAPADASYVVHARLRALYESPSFRAVADPLFPPEHLRSFDERTGVDLTQVDEAMYARLGEGRFLIAVRVERAPEVAFALGMRMSTLDVRDDQPFVRRVGFLGTVRREVVGVGDDLLLLGAGAGAEIAGLLEGIRSGELPPHALAGPDGPALVASASDAPFSLHAPKPLELPLETGIGMLLARERAATLAIEPAEGHLNVRALVIGELPPGGEANLRHFATSLAGTDMGAALGINQAVNSLDLQVSSDRTQMSVEWPVHSLARGLRVLFTEELDALLEEPVFAE